MYTYKEASGGDPSKFFLIYSKDDDIYWLNNSVSFISYYGNSSTLWNINSYCLEIISTGFKYTSTPMTESFYIKWHAFE